ncbi:MAG: hypothetical protein GXP37_04710 [Chloroflexi bacterium]|nr:hypothetical protein [Chloroflexota bacterium]
MTPTLHKDFTDVDVTPVLDNFRRLHQTGAPLRSESIVIPGTIDAPEIERIAAFIASVHAGIPYRLDAYIPVPGAPWPRPTAAEMEAAASAARRHLRQVSVLHSGRGKRYGLTRLV